MKKVIRLTESDLVKIVNKVIEEQKITDNKPVIPQNAKITIDDEALKQLNGNQSKINFKKYEAPKTFLDKLNASKIAFNAFHIPSEGYNIAVLKTVVNLPIGDDTNIALSCEPFNKEYGVTMCRVTKKIGK